MMEINVDFKTMERLKKLSDDNLTLCYQCGTCSATCPYAYLANKEISVRKLIRLAQLGYPVTDKSLWLCSMCSHCEFACPRGVEITKILRGLRVVSNERKEIPQKVNETLWQIFERGNPWGFTKVELKKAIVKMKVKKISNPAKVTISACCMSFIDPTIQKTTRNLLMILEKAGVSYHFQRDDKNYCCGDFIYQVGEDAYLEEYINQKASQLEEINTEVLIVTSPHCMFMYKNVYPKYGVKLPVEVLHYTQYISELIDNGNLQLKQNGLRVTYHDPCYLGRKGGVIEDPRKILEVVSKDNFIEMEHNKYNSICCGAGGGLMFLETEGQPPSILRIKEANDVEAEILATACPYCIRMFDDAAKISDKAPKIADISDIVVKSLQ